MDSRVEPADFECDYEGHRKLPGDAIHLFEAAVHRFLRPEIDPDTKELIRINPPVSPVMHLSLGLGTKTESGESSNPPMQSSVFCCLLNGGRTQLRPDTSGKPNSYNFFSKTYFLTFRFFELYLSVYCYPQRYFLLPATPHFLNSMFLDHRPNWKSLHKHRDNMVSLPKQESLSLTPSNGDVSQYEDALAAFSPEFPGCLPVNDKRLEPAFQRRHPEGRTQTRSGTFTIDFTGVSLAEVEYLLLTLHFLSQYVFPGHYPAIFRPAWLSELKPTVELSVRARWFLLSLDSTDRRSLASFAKCGHDVCCNSRLAVPLRLRMSGRCMHCVCPLSDLNCQCRICPYIPEHLLHL